jgi:hypothetical protein
MANNTEIPFAHFFHHNCSSYANYIVTHSGSGHDSNSINTGYRTLTFLQKILKQDLPMNTQVTADNTSVISRYTDATEICWYTVKKQNKTAACGTYQLVTEITVAQLSGWKCRNANCCSIYLVSTRSFII